MAVVIGMAGCGGGGGSGGGVASNDSAALSSFTAADFSGKSVYLVDGSTYQLGIFYSDGTVRASDQLKTGTPVLTAETANWSIVNGRLVIATQSDNVQFSPISNNNVEHYFKTTKYSSNGVTNTFGMFYDQSSALSQAKNFVATHRLPEGGPCDGVDTSKTPDSISVAFVNGKAVTTSTWGACTK